MQLVPIDQDQAATMISVLGAVVTARGTRVPSDADRVVVRDAAGLLLGGPAVPRELAWSIPGDVAEQLSSPDAVALTMSIASMLCCSESTSSVDGADEIFDPVRVTVVDDLARYLNVPEREVRSLRRRIKHHRDRIALDQYRRFLVGRSDEDLTSTRAAVVHAEKRLDIDARRVHALWNGIERLPDGTVGAELVRYYGENGWRYPGTDHQLPITLAEHDLHHVLGGYATTPAGELQVGAFIAGVATRPMDSALALLIWDQLAADDPLVPDARAAFDLDRFVAALNRGSRTTRDFVGRGWDPWALVDRDLDEVRAQHRIGAGAQLGPHDPYNLDPYDLDPALTRH